MDESADQSVSSVTPSEPVYSLPQPKARTQPILNTPTQPSQPNFNTPHSQPNFNTPSYQPNYDNPSYQPPQPNFNTPHSQPHFDNPSYQPPQPNYNTPTQPSQPTLNNQYAPHNNNSDGQQQFFHTPPPLTKPPANGFNASTPMDPGIFKGYSTDTLATSNSGQKYLLPDDIDDGKQHFGEDENKERGNWSGKLDFLLSCLGYAVGLGNVWRFPYLCYRNGGGAFFIPYIIMLTFVGVPLFFLELSLGQFSSNGPLTCWEFAPLFKGIGIAQLIISSLVAIYYNMIIAWSLYYLFASFAALPGLQWDNCDNQWNTDYCSLKVPDVECLDSGLTQYENGTCYNMTMYKQQDLVGIWNYTVFNNETGIRRVSPSEEYYNNKVLHLSSGIHDMGPVKWDLALALLGAWIIAFLCMIKGIKSSGKVVYFTALFPYAVLIILCGRGASLDGSIEGVKFYVIPKWERLADAKVWYDAAVQIFFSLSLSSGGLTALSSYNRFHNPVFRDTIIVAIGNCLTSIFAGFIIFSFLGFMANEMNTTVEKVVDSGPGLAFIVYPDAVTRMPISPLWAILFFSMLLTLGLDSQFAMLETVLTSLLDRFSWMRPNKTKVIAVISVTFFLLGLTMCSQGGAYILQLMDTYSGGWAILIIGILECVSIGWVYGGDRFFDDIRVMIGKRPWLWWRICWQGISPVIMIGIVLFSWIDYSPARYGKYDYPIWADIMGWMMSFCSVIWIPIIAVYKICKDDGGIGERIRNLCLPTVEWGPALVKHRKLVDYVEGFKIDPWGTGSKKTVVPAFSNPALNLGSPQQAPTQGNAPNIYLSPASVSLGLSMDSADHAKSEMSYGAHSNASFVSFESTI